MIAVGAIFLGSCLVTILLVLRRPYLYIRMRRRRTRVDTYFLGALLGPLLIVAGRLLTGRELIAGLNGRGGVAPLGILTLFLSMVFMSIFLDITGVFEACARLALRTARADGRRLFFATYVAVAVLTTFTSNDIVILAFTPFIYYFARAAGIDPRPYLLAEFFAANTWSMLLYIGNPTNILIASSFDLRFVDYTRWMLLPTLAAGAVNAVLLDRIFHRSIDRPIRPPASLERPLDAITDRPGAALGLGVLLGCVIALGVAPYVGIEMWKVSLAFALSLLAVLAVRDSYTWALRRRFPGGANGSTVGGAMQRMPWTIVPFVLSLFMTVYALRMYGVTEWAGEVLARLGRGSPFALAMLYGAASAASANVLNNIPMTLAFSSIMQTLTGRDLLAAALATTVGSNLGANLTPLGALAGIMWMSILRGKGYSISFAEFAKYGLLVTPLSLLAALVVLGLELTFL